MLKNGTEAATAIDRMSVLTASAAIVCANDCNTGKILQKK